jgi:peptidoglycan/xylan/chitin deacetylase (PgdA/CDA1 family)
MQTNNTDPFWPDKARLVISISMQMEAGAQPESGAESPLPRIDPKYPDIAATKWYEYGFKEGLPRLLEMFDRRKVKVTSHMVGAAVERTLRWQKRLSSVATNQPVTARPGRRSIP